MKLRVAHVSTLVVGAMALAPLTAGTAAADYAGQTYADASKAASNAKQTVVIASRVGDAVAQDECMVVRSQSAPFIHGTTQVSNTVEFYLNCNAGVATATTPGNSAASPEGRAAIAAAQEKAAREQAQSGSG